jgi:hypothetical protein
VRPSGETAGDLKTGDPGQGSGVEEDPADGAEGSESGGDREEPRERGHGARGRRRGGGRFEEVGVVADVAKALARVSFEAAGEEAADGRGGGTEVGLVLED